jgi:ABC-type multidrug transport system ATPase subunit
MSLGKSTLLDVLAGRLDSKYQTGMLTANGVKIRKRHFRRESGYVMQSDALFPFLTVRETFRYAAYFRVPDKTSAEKDEIADNTIKLLRLETAANTIVGDENVRGVSGGEKRRVSIGVDIVHQPKVIFLVSYQFNHMSAND